MEIQEKTSLKKLDWLIAVGIAALAAVLYFAGMASFAYPGESAHLTVLWRGLDVSEAVKYPLMGYFAKLLGAGNLLAPISGMIAATGLFLLVAFFVRVRIGSENLEGYAITASRLAGITAAVLFMLSPAVRAAATHLEPRLFAVTWVIVAMLPFLAWYNAGPVMAKVWPILVGFLWGLGSVDTPLCALLSPLVLGTCIAVPLVNGRKPYVEAVLFLLATALTFIVTAVANAGFIDTIDTLWHQFRAYAVPKGWLVILFFATTAFVVSLFSSKKAFNEESGLVQWIFHVALGICSILMLATPLAPSALMAPAGIFPCAACVYVACVAGYLIAYWWMLTQSDVRHNESQDEAQTPMRQRAFAYVCGGILACVYVFVSLFNLFTFDAQRGAFADRMAAKIVDDLGDREWYVSDGTLDDHLRLVCAERGKKLTLICLSRDEDKQYLERLSAVVAESGIGGTRNKDLTLALSLGVLPFVQDWFAADPQAAKSTAIFGAPDLWHSAEITPVPEFVFFGADPVRTVDWGVWKEYAAILDAPKDWGSYKMRRDEVSPVERMKFELRRHLGFVANNRGVWLQDQGRDDEAFALYSLVLDEIDKDNVCALFNLFEMARAKHPKAMLKKFEYERRIKAITDDVNRRYQLWSLSNYYGYIRNPDIFIRLGYTWARSGRSGEALSQIRRAIDFIPTDRRNSVMNMMASLYASEDNRAKSREVYEKVLEQDANDHDALMGLMQLALRDGDEKLALEFLDRATKAGGDDPRIRVEQAMAALMRGELEQAKKLLSTVTDADATDLRAWSLLAAVTMQQCDAAKDEKMKRVFERELEDKILPTMEKQTRDPYDYYVQTTRAFVLMRKDGADKRREARDAFAVAAKARPDIAATRDIVLGLDISLDDTEAAEAHARETLRTDRKNPIANYVMGALSLRRGNYDEAAHYLHKAADAKQKAVVMAMNDLAEVYRRQKSFSEAERYARMAIQSAPDLYVSYETLGTVLVEADGDLEEAKRNIEKAVELCTKDGRVEDARMIISLARVQLKSGDKRQCRMSLRKVQNRLAELSDFEREEYDELTKQAQDR